MIKGSINATITHLESLLSSSNSQSTGSQTYSSCQVVRNGSGGTVTCVYARICSDEFSRLCITNVLHLMPPFFYTHPSYTPKRSQKADHDGGGRRGFGFIWKRLGQARCGGARGIQEFPSISSSEKNAYYYRTSTLISSS